MIITKDCTHFMQQHTVVITKDCTRFMQQHTMIINEAIIIVVKKANPSQRNVSTG